MARGQTVGIAGELMGAAEWDTDEAKALMRYYIERIDDKIDKTDATDFGRTWLVPTGPDLRPTGFPLPTIQHDQGIVKALTDFGRREARL